MMTMTNSYYEKIMNWNGSFCELVKHLTDEAYQALLEDGTLDYTDEDWMEEHFEDKHVFLANFIRDGIGITG